MKKIFKKRITLKELLTAKLPPGIMSRISPLITIGSGVLISAFVLLFIPALRGGVPMFAVLGILFIVFALWKKAEVLIRGYDVHVFKVVDYSQFMPITTKHTTPTGMFLLRKDLGEDEQDNSVYHIATSGKGSLLPPIDWLIKVYVPKGMQAVSYGDKKYFPTVYGYSIFGEDK